MRKFSIFLISILLPINVFAMNNTGINITEEEYNNLLNFGYSREEIDDINDSMAIESDLDDESKVKETATNKILENANYEIDSQTIEKIYDENDKMLKWKVRSVVHEKDSDSYFVNVYYENL